MKQLREKFCGLEVREPPHLFAAIMGVGTGAMKLLLSPPLLQPMVLTPLRAVGVPCQGTVAPIPAASPPVGQRPAHAAPEAAGILVQASLAAMSTTGPTATSLSSPAEWATLQFGLLPDPGLELYGTPWSDVSRQALPGSMPLYLTWRGVQQDSWCLSTMRGLWS